MGQTKIGWTSSFNPKTGLWEMGYTFNGWIGCTNVQPGCDNCYAEVLSHRMKWAKWGPGEKRMHTSPGNWKKPLAWDRAAAKAGHRIKIFAFSLADVFDAEVPDEWRTELFDLIDQTTNTDWLLLTKRSALPRRYKLAPWDKIWLGVSVDDDKWAFRVHDIADVPAKKHWISHEPALGPFDLESVDLATDWIVVGGESEQAGKCRPFNIRWARAIIEDGRNTGIPVFVKQLGSKPVDVFSDWSEGICYLHLNDHHGSDWREWPEDLRVRQFPDGTEIEYKE